MKLHILIGLFVIANSITPVDTSTPCVQDLECVNCIKMGCFFVKTAKNVTCLEKLLPNLRIRKVYASSSCSMVPSTLPTKLSPTEASPVVRYEEMITRITTTPLQILLHETKDAPSKIALPSEKVGSTDAPTKTTCHSTRYNFTLGLLPGLEIKNARVFFNGTATRFVIHRQPHLVLRLMKSYCNNYVLVKMHIHAGGASAAKFEKSLRNNPMQKFPEICALLTNRRAMNSTTAEKGAYHLNPLPLISGSKSDLKHTCSCAVLFMYILVIIFEN